jgi:hypothetical protein
MTNLITATLAICKEYGTILAGAFWKKALAAMETLFVKEGGGTSEEWDAAILEAASRAQIPSHWQSIADYITANYAVFGRASREKFFGFCHFDILVEFVAGEGKLLHSTLLSLAANDDVPLDSADFHKIHMCLSGLTALAEESAAWTEPLFEVLSVFAAFIELRGTDETFAKGFQSRREGIMNRFKTSSVPPAPTPTQVVAPVSIPAKPQVTPVSGTQQKAAPKQDVVPARPAPQKLAPAKPTHKPETKEEKDARRRAVAAKAGTHNPFLGLDRVTVQ